MRRYEEHPDGGMREDELGEYVKFADVKAEIEKFSDVLVALREAVEFSNLANNYIAGQDLPASSEWLAVISKAEGVS